MAKKVVIKVSVENQAENTKKEAHEELNRYSFGAAFYNAGNGAKRHWVWENNYQSGGSSIAQTVWMKALHQDDKWYVLYGTQYVQQQINTFASDCDVDDCWVQNTMKTMYFKKFDSEASMLDLKDHLFDGREPREIST